MNPPGRTERAPMTADDARRTGLIAERWPAEEVLAWGAERFAPRITLATGFGVEGCVLIDLIARNDLPSSCSRSTPGCSFPRRTHCGSARTAVRRQHSGGNAGADGGRAGAHHGRGAVGARTESLLRAPQGDTADRHAGRSTPGSPRFAANRPRTRHSPASSGTRRTVVKINPSSLDHVEGGGRRAPQHAVQRAVRPGIADRLRAVHDAGSAARTARRTVARQQKTECGLHRWRGDRVQSRHTAPGAILWFTGLSGAGKSTLAQALTRAARPGRGRDSRRRRDAGAPVEGPWVLKEDRDTNIRRIGFVARLLARTAWSRSRPPSRRTRRRDEVRRAADETACRLSRFRGRRDEALAGRDVKGLYSRRWPAKLAHFTGVSDPYEPPLSPDVVVRSDRETVDESAARRARWLIERGLSIAPRFRQEALVDRQSRASLFPVFLNSRAAGCWSSARARSRRRSWGLLAAGALVTVVAPEIVPDIEQAAVAHGAAISLKGARST